MQAYATGFYRKRSGDPLQYLIEEARERVAQGFGAIKLKLGFDFDEDVRLCHEVRRAVGDGVMIMVDANHGTTPPPRSVSGAGSKPSTSSGSRSRCRPKITPAIAR